MSQTKVKSGLIDFTEGIDSFIEFSGGNSTVTGNLTVTGTLVGYTPTASLNISNWDTAYGWGNHASVGYLTSFDITTQTDAKYLRSDESDTMTGSLTTTGNITVGGILYVPDNIVHYGDNQTNIEFATGQFKVNTGGLARLSVTDASVQITNPLVASSTLSVAGNLAVDISTLFVDVTNNRVGIGTTSPSTNLHVSAGAVSSPRGSGFTKFFFTGDHASTTYFEIQTPSTSTGDILFSDASGGAYGIIGYDHSTDTMRIYTNSNPNLVINSSGNVGIGTTSPNRGLTISRSNEFASLNIYKSNTANQVVYLGTGSSGPEDLGILQLLDGGTTKIQLYTGGNSYFNGGNVGIGTTSPNGNLQFASSINTRKIVLFEGGNNNFQFYGFGVENSTLVYSTFTTDDDHVFFAGINTTSRKESARIHGDGGISFNGDTATSNILDDYEEGTWTPQIIRHYGTIPASFSIGTGTATYVKIGRLVFLKCFITNLQDGSSDGSSYWRINGVPFPGTQYAATKLAYSNMPSDGAYIGDAAGNLILTNNNAPYYGSFGTSKEFMLTLCYETNS